MNPISGFQRQSLQALHAATPFKHTLVQRVILLLTCLVFFSATGKSQTTRYAGTATELTTAITNSTSGDVISITNNIVVAAEVSLTKSITIQGNNYTISVPVTGLNDQGKFNVSPSNFRVFFCGTASTTIVINNLMIKGGRLTTVSQHGGAIDVAVSTVSLTLNNCVISNGVGNGATSGTSNGGGGIRNAGKLFMNNCYLRRNAAQFGGALLNEGTGIAFLEKTTMTENRVTSADGGGGAIENRAGGNIYFNNSTLSNNQSQIVGGAVNNLNGTLYFINSSATGNVVYGASGATLVGGALSNYNGSMFIVNSLLVHNYRRSGGTASSPGAFILDDITAYASQAGVHMLYSIYHAAMPTGMGTNSNNIPYTGNADGSNNTIFSGGDNSMITDYQGLTIGTASVYRPFLYSGGSASAGPTLKAGSFATQSGNAGTPTRFANKNGVNPVLSYWNGSAFVAVNARQVGTAGDLVQSDQAGTTRANPPSRGAIEAAVTNLYMVKVNATANGLVTGGSTYGDVYPSGASVTVTAVPNAGYTFTRWDWVLGGTGTASANSTYTFAVNQSITLLPVFTAAAAGSYSVTYVGNGNTAGTLPATQNFTAGSGIAGIGTVVRNGYAFTGWNTAANGSGTAFAAGATYSAGVNLVLYAQWQEVQWTGSLSDNGSNTQNWLPAQVPPAGSSFSIAANAATDLVLSANAEYDIITFKNANRKIVLMNGDLKVAGLANADAGNYVQTTGTGRLKMTIDNGGSKTFPSGKSTYNPVTITNNSGAADEFAVTVLDEVYSNGNGGTTLSANRVARTWDITKLNVNGGSGVNLAFNWNSGENAGAITAPALFHYSNGWTKQTGATAYTANSLTYTGYSGTFSPFSILDANAILPVTWLGFSAREQRGGIALNWATAAELNTKKYTIQHSPDGINWRTIGELPSTGNSSSTSEYRFLHTEPFAGKNNYRLLQVDLDGKENYSKVLSLVWQRPNDAWQLMGNPVVGNRLKINMLTPAVMQISAAGGGVVWQARLEKGLQTIPVGNFGKGIYFLYGAGRTERVLIK